MIHAKASMGLLYQFTRIDLSPFILFPCPFPDEKPSSNSGTFLSAVVTHIMYL
jgi:hypothetical protein